MRICFRAGYAWVGEKGESELRLVVKISSLSLDPCAAYEVEVHNA